MPLDLLRICSASIRPDDFSWGRSIWVMSPVDHRFGAEAQTGEKHLPLFGGGVLRLVENYKSVVESSPAHKRQGRHFDDALVDQGGGLVNLHHVEKGIVQRTEIGVDLFCQISGQESELLSGLNRGAGEGDVDTFSCNAAAMAMAR